MLSPAASCLATIALSLRDKYTRPPRLYFSERLWVETFAPFNSLQAAGPRSTSLSPTHGEEAFCWRLPILLMPLA